MFLIEKLKSVEHPLQVSLEMIFTQLNYGCKLQPVTVRIKLIL